MNEDAWPQRCAARCRRNQTQLNIRSALRGQKRLGVAAFTLVEMLVVTAILAVLIGVIGACLSGGVRVWDTVRTHGQAEAQLSIALRILERDLANATPFCDVGMRGSASELSFVGLLRENVGPTASGGGREEVATAEVAYVLALVQYRYDPSRAALLRIRQPYRAGSAAAVDSRAETLLTGVQGLAFRYEQVDPDGKRSTQSEWNNLTNFPAMVHVDLATKSEGSARHTVRLFRIPVTIQAPVAITTK